MTCTTTITRSYEEVERLVRKSRLGFEQEIYLNGHFVVENYCSGAENDYDNNIIVSHKHSTAYNINLTSIIIYTV